jgi:hypothetical protein
MESVNGVSWGPGEPFRWLMLLGYWVTGNPYLSTKEALFWDL